MRYKATKNYRIFCRNFSKLMFLNSKNCKDRLSVTRRIENTGLEEMKRKTGLPEFEVETNITRFLSPTAFPQKLLCT